MDEERITVTGKCRNKATSRPVPDMLMITAFKAGLRIRENIQKSNLFELENIKVDWAYGIHNSTWHAELTINIKSELTASKKILRILINWEISKDNYLHNIMARVVEEKSYIKQWSDKLDLTQPGRGLGYIDTIIPRHIFKGYAEVISNFINGASYKLSKEKNRILQDMSK